MHICILPDPGLSMFGCTVYANFDGHRDNLPCSNVDDAYGIVVYGKSIPGNMSFLPSEKEICVPFSDTHNEPVRNC